MHDLSCFQELLAVNPPRYNTYAPRPNLSEVAWWSDFILSCNEHASHFANGAISTVNLLVVHPYHSEVEDKVQSGKAKIQKLEELLRSTRKNGITNILFDGYYVYGMKSHKLAEEGLIDNVVFTYDDSGIPLYTWNLREFADSRTNYVAGSYGAMCLGLATLWVRLYALNSSIIPVRDLILYRNLLVRVLSFGELWHRPFGITSEQVL